MAAAAEVAAAAAGDKTSKQTEKEIAHIEWDCCEDEPEKRQYLANILPEEFNYKVNKLNVEEMSDICEETKFKLNFWWIFAQKKKLLTSSKWLKRKVEVVTNQVKKT